MCSSRLVITAKRAGEEGLSCYTIFFEHKLERWDGGAQRTFAEVDPDPLRHRLHDRLIQVIRRHGLRRVLAHRSRVRGGDCRSDVAFDERVSVSGAATRSWMDGASTR